MMIIYIKDIFGVGMGGGVEMGAGERYKARRRTIIFISHTLYHPHSISLEATNLDQDCLINSIYN